MKSPYKFLDYYGTTDSNIFFGRRKEIEILLADIDIERLVVLFAKTGTGKTSLINAGVIPRLEDLRYHTIYARVEEDPTEALFKVLQFRYLFSVEPSFINELDAGQLSELLHDEFLRQSTPLTAQAKVTVEQTESKWTIDDAGTKYFIRNEAQTLNVYQSSGIPLLGTESLSQQLKVVAAYVKKPLVVFFDQFEEFFFFIEKQGEKRGQAFVREVGQVYRDPKLRVHIVFSLREDFYGGMDIFREEIPSIFHLDSNLRLLPFDASQARAAIMGPAECAKPQFHIEPDLVDTLIKDLANLSPGDRIEPAHLQIVCDTLWQRRRDNRSTLQDYLAMGGAPGILSRRLREDLDENLSQEQLAVFAQMLDLLTDRKHDVKRPRQINELIDMLAVDSKELETLIKQLIALRLVRERSLESTKYIEWVTDYVAKTIGELELSVRTITTQKRFKAFVETWPTIAASTDQNERVQLSAKLEEEFRHISMNVGLLTLKSDQALFMLLRAMEYNFDAVGWLNRARALDVDVWQVLEARISTEKPSVDDRVQGDSAVQLLGDVLQASTEEEQAWRLMRMALDRDWLAVSVVRALGSIDVPHAIDLLRQASMQETVVADVISVLGRTPESIDLLADIVDRDVQHSHALEAIRRLDQVAKGRRSKASIHAEEVLALILDKNVEELFGVALRRGIDMKFWFDAAEGHAVDVWSRLRTQVDSSGASAANAVNLLGEIATTQAIELLKSALTNDALMSLAKGSLQRVIDVRSAERKRLEEELCRTLDENTRIQLTLQLDKLAQVISNALAAYHRRGEATTEAKQAFVQETERSIKAEPTVVKQPRISSSGEEKDWALLLRRISDGKCTPFLGPGVNPGLLPSDAEIAQQWSAEYRYPLSDKNNLSRVAQFLAEEYDPLFPKEVISRRLYHNLTPPDLTDVDEIHGILAALPLPVYITTNYDDFMVQALHSRMKKPTRQLCAWNPMMEDRFARDRALSDFMPTVAQPVVFHLFGHHEVPESLVLTEDDYLDFLVNLSRDERLLPSFIRRALSGTTLVFIGYDRVDWGLRVVVRGLVGSTEPSIRRRLNIVISSSAEADLLEPQQEKLWEDRYQNYLSKYFEGYDTRPYWGTVTEFARELRQRWENFSDGN